MDLIQLLGLMLLFDWLYRERDRFMGSAPTALFSLAAILGLGLMTVIYARSVHH